MSAPLSQLTRWTLAKYSTFRRKRLIAGAERARVGVTQALRHAIGRIREYHSPLGEHLDRTIRTGTYCSYMPDPRIQETWRVKRRTVARNADMSGANVARPDRRPTMRA